MTLPRQHNNTRSITSSAAFVQDKITTAAARPIQPTLKKYDDTKVVDDYDPANSKAKTKKKRPYGQPVKNIELVLTAEDIALIKKLQTDTGTFNVVFQKMIDGELWYIKITPPGSPSAPNEAALGEISKFYLDGLSADAAAAYAINADGLPEYIAKASKAVPNFESLLKHPLTDEELKISVLDQGLMTIEQLDEIDEEYARNNTPLEKLDKDVLILGRVPISDLIHYRKIKKLATILTFDQFAEEDDAHKNNIGNANFDDGDKGAEVNFKYKEADKLLQQLVGPLNKLYRNPEGRYIVHVHDLDNSPHLIYDKRVVWVDRPGPDYPTIIGKVREMMELDVKFYKEGEEINRYIALKNHPVYKFHKNKMHLRLIITDPKIFGPLLSLQLKESFAKEIAGKLCYPHREFNELFQRRQSEYKRELRKSQQFKEFLSEHGSYAMKIIEENYARYNKALEPLIDECKNDEKPGYKEDLLVSIDQLRTNYINTVLDLRGNVTQQTLLAALKHGNLDLVTSVIKVMKKDEKAAISFQTLNAIAEGNPFKLSKAYLEQIFELHLRSGKLTAAVTELAKANDISTISYAKILKNVGLNRPSTPPVPASNLEKTQPHPGASL